MLSQTSEHAIRAILFLAQQPRGQAVPADRVAAALGAPANYLGKTLNALARRGLLASARGPAGGFRLVREPARITVADVVAAVSDAPRGRPMCLLGNRECNAARPCAAHARWSGLQDGFRATTVADLLAADTPDLPGAEPVSAPIPRAAAAA